MRLIILDTWDTLLKKMVIDLHDIMIIDVNNIEIKKYENVKFYKGFNIDEICKYCILKNYNVVDDNYVDKCCSYIDYFEQLFKTNNFTEFICWNNVTSFRRVGYLFAKKYNIKTTIIDVASFPYRFIVDSDNVNIHSNFYNKWNNEYKFQELKQCQKDDLRAFIHRYHQTKESRIQSDNKFEFKKHFDYWLVALQVQNDANILYYNYNNFNNRKIFEFISNNKNMFFYIKNHPMDDNKEQTTKKFMIFDNVKFVDEYNIHDLLINSSGVITVNSSVGIEALTYSKRVLCLGKSIYSDCSVINMFDNINQNLIDQFLYNYIFKFTKTKNELLGGLK